jgi:pimeloyl-ACP methyl ester carboxylesterase
MAKVYLISGLGADRRLFKNITIPNYEVVLVDWLIPNPDDTLTTYATKLINHYHIQAGDVVIGVSLGGMISIEIAKQLSLDKVILISSIKADSEAPLYFKVFRNIPVYKLTPGSLVTRLGFMVKPIFGHMANADAALFKDMLRNSSPVFIKWAMGAVLKWRNTTVFDNLYHIIGNKDLVFPHKNIKNPSAVIKGGTHIMVFDKAAEINELLAGILQK